MVPASVWELLEHLGIPSDTPWPCLHARACVHHGNVAYRSQGFRAGGELQHALVAVYRAERGRSLNFILLSGNLQILILFGFANFR